MFVVRSTTGSNYTSCMNEGSTHLNGEGTIKNSVWNIQQVFSTFSSQKTSRNPKEEKKDNTKRLFKKEQNLGRIRKEATTVSGITRSRGG